MRGEVNAYDFLECDSANNKLPLVEINLSMVRLFCLDVGMSISEIVAHVHCGFV